MGKCFGKSKKKVKKLVSIISIEKILENNSHYYQLLNKLISFSKKQFRNKFLEFN